MVGAPSGLSISPWRAERILFDADGWLVVDKPQGVVVHGGRDDLRDSVVERLADYFERTEGRARQLGVHSRLDVETSGVLLFTTAPRNNELVRVAMEDGSYRRTYRALVRRAPQCRLKGAGRIELELDFVDGRALVRSGGKRAITHFRVLEERGDLLSVELRLETGRPHQIRASLAHWGAPIVGDLAYGGVAAPRLFLHALALEAKFLPKNLEAPLPSEFGEWLSGANLEFPTSRRVLRERFFDAATHRAPLQLQTSAFRLVNGMGDLLPGLTVDVYGEYATVNPYEPNVAKRVQEISDLLLALGFRGAYLKGRVRADLRAKNHAELAPDVPLFGVGPSSGLVVSEGEMQIGIDLTDGLSTGLFVDQRENRARIRSGVGGGHLLNLFCYTSSFSVAAALGGATTTNVDLSGRALERSRENFLRNGLELDGHRFIKEDALKYLARAAARGELFDGVVLDPPSFATVGKKGTFRIGSDYLDAIVAALAVVRPGGLLLLVTNHLKTSLGSFERLARRAAYQAERRLLSFRALPSAPDCPPASGEPFPSKSILLRVGPRMVGEGEGTSLIGARFRASAQPRRAHRERRRS